MFCTNCGSPVPDGASFCTNCGTPVSAQGGAGAAAAVDAPGQMGEKEVAAPVSQQAPFAPEPAVPAPEPAASAFDPAANYGTGAAASMPGVGPQFGDDVASPNAQPANAAPAGQTYATPQYGAAPVQGQQPQGQPYVGGDAQYGNAQYGSPQYGYANMQQPAMQTPQQKKNSKLGIVIGIVAAVVVVGIIIAVLGLGKCTVESISTGGTSTGSAGSTESSELAGEWVFVSMYEDGESYTSEDLEGYFEPGDVCSLYLYSDGNFDFYVFGESVVDSYSQSFRWEPTSNGIRFGSDEEWIDVKYDSSKNQINFDVDGTGFVLGRSSDSTSGTRSTSVTV